MKKLLLILALIPSIAFGQAVVYQPPTPVPLLAKTPGARGFGVAVNEFLQQQQVLSGSVTANISGTPVSVNTPTADWPVLIDATLQGTIPVSQADTRTTGTLDMTTTASAVSVNCNGYSTISYQGGRTVETGTVEFDLSLDNANWKTYQFFTDIGATGAGLTTTASGTANVTSFVLGTVFWQPMGPFRYARVKVNSTGTGSTLPVTLSCNPGSTYVVKSLTGVASHTQPSVTNATNFNCLPSNPARHGFIIQNGTAANIMINLGSGTLTGIIPTSSNLGIVLTPGSSYTSPADYTVTGGISCYQTSGSTTNLISVVEFQ